MPVLPETGYISPMAVCNGGQHGAISMEIIPRMSVRHTHRDKKEFGFAIPVVSGKAERERKQHVGRSPPKVPSQKDKEIQLKPKPCNLTLDLD